MEKIAVVRLDKIGDLILTTPAIATLRATYPGASITAIVNPYNKVVLENSPDVNQIREWHPSRTESFDRLRAEKFDQVIVFSPTTRSYHLAWCSNARIRAGYIYQSRVLVRMFSKLWLNRRLICEVDQKDLEKRHKLVPHEVEQNLDLVRFLNPEAIVKDELVVRIPEEEIRWAREELQGTGWIGIHFSNAWIENLPKDFFGKLLKKLAANHPIFLTSGPDDAAKAAALALPQNARLVSNLSFQRWGSLLGRASAVLSTNTGAAHLAASQKSPVVAVFEPEFFAYHEQRWRPWKVPCAVLRKDDPGLLNKITEEVGKLSDAQSHNRSNLQL